MASYNLSSSINFTILTDQTGSALYDSGGPAGNYSDNENFYVMIAPAYATGTLTLNITSFESEVGWDYLRVYSDIPPTSSYNYDSKVVGGYLTHVLNGTLSLPYTITSSTGKAYLRWNSDNSVNRAGFGLEWTGSGFYAVNSSSNVTTNKYALNLPLGATTGSYVTFDKGIFTGSTLTADKDILFGAWIKADKNGLNDTNIRGIFGLGSNNAKGITLYRPSGVYYDLGFYYRDNNGTFTTTFTDILMGGQGASVTYPPQWHQYGFAIRKTSTTGAIVYAYRDGYLFGTSSVVNTASWAVFSASSDLTLGAYRVSNTIISSSNNTWSGSFDDVFMANVITGAAESVYTNFFVSMYNSGNWTNPNSVITGAFSSSYTPRVLFNWRFEETGSVLNTKDYGYYGNVHSASSVGGASTLTATSSGISYTPYSSLAYSASVASPTNATVSFSTSSVSVYENTSSYTIGILVSTASSGQAATASVNITSSAGSASFGTDYKLIYNNITYSSSIQMPIYVSWSAGETTTKYITASIFDNIIRTGISSSIPLKLSNFSGVDVGSPSLFSLKILDYEEGIPSFTSASYSVGELGTNLLVYVDRLSGSNGPLSVNYSTSDSTALSGTNYTSTNGTLSWADTEVDRKSFSIPILQDKIQTSNLYFNISLNNLSTGSFNDYPLALRTAQATIEDQEPGTFALSTSSYSGSEGQSILVRVNRYSGSYGNVDVTITSSNGTALAGTDYTAVNTTLAFLNGEVFKGFYVTTLDNSTDVVGPLNFTIGIKELSAPVPDSAIIGSPSSATILITDNETGSIRFTNSSFTGSFGSIITIPVERYTAGDFAATASIGVSGGTAVAGLDYTNIFPYTLTWADQVSGSINIPLQTLSTNVWSGNKTLTLTASNLTNIGVGTIMTASILFSAGVIEKSVQPYENYDKTYVINDYANLSSQFRRRVQQVPFSLQRRGTGTPRKP